MLKIHALNRDSSSDEDAPGIRREAQVTHHYQHKQKIVTLCF